MTRHIRALIERTAAETEGVGPLIESVKWGEPSFTPQKPRVGSSVRIQQRANGDVALMFICHTNLVEEFRTHYGNRLVFEGNRAIVLPDGRITDEEAVSHCLAMAFTYHRRKRERATLQN